MRNEKIYYIIRIIAGAYVIYLAYSILRDVAAGKTGEHTTLLAIGGAVFVAAGAAFIFWGLKGLKKAMGSSGQEPSETEPAAEEEIPEETEEIPEETEESLELDGELQDSEEEKEEDKDQDQE